MEGPRGTREQRSAAYIVILTVVFIDLVLLYRFFAQRALRGTLAQTAVIPSPGSGRSSDWAMSRYRPSSRL